MRVYINYFFSGLEHCAYQATLEHNMYFCPDIIQEFVCGSKKQYEINSNFCRCFRYVVHMYVKVLEKDSCFNFTNNIVSNDPVPISDHIIIAGGQRWLWKRKKIK